LGAPKTTWTARPGAYFNMQDPSPNSTVWVTDGSHRPCPSYAAYLATGEPQFLELMLGAAFGQVMSAEPTYRAVYNDRPRATTTSAYFGARGLRINNTGSTYEVGGLIFTPGGVRTAAWRVRDIGLACGICPDTHPDGADYKGHLNWVVQNVFESFNAVIAGSPTAFRNSGLFITENKETISAIAESPWMDNYWVMSTALLSKITENAEAITARSYFAKKFSSLDAIGHPLQLGAYRYQGFTASGIVESYEDVLFTLSCTLTFSTTGNTVTLSGVSGFGDWDFTNGDVFMIPGITLNSGAQPYSTGGDFVNFYVVNASGKTCNFAATLGGATLTVLRNAVASGIVYGRVQTAAAGFSPGHAVGGSVAIASAAGTASYLEALGEPVGTAAAKMRTSLAINIPSSEFEIEPKYAFMPAIPA